MQALIDFIMQNLRALWPIVRVCEWEVAFMLRNGHIHRTLGPGLHWRWIFVEKEYTQYSTELNIDLDNAAIVTSDGESIIVSANVGYKIVDLPQLWRTLCNSNDTIKQIAVGFLAGECMSRTWEELAEGSEMLEQELVTHLQEMVNDKGLKIIRVQITDLIPTRAFRLYGNTEKLTG